MARLSVPYGDRGGWPAIHLEMMINGTDIPVHLDAPSVYHPLHEDDIIAMIPGLIGDAEIQPKSMHGCDIRFGAAALALKHAFEAGGRADDEADILAALALQDAGANRRQRVGACDRRNQRNDGNTKCRESHESFPRMMS